MKKIFRLALALLTLALTAAIPLHAGNGGNVRSEHAPAPSAPQYLDGTIVLKLKRTTPNIRGGQWFQVAALDDVVARLDINGRRSLFPLAAYPEVRALGGAMLPADMQGFDRVYVITYVGKLDARIAAQQIVATGLVEFAEPYYIFPTSYTPNDPLLAAQTWLTNIQAQQAWNVTKGDSTITIGIVDTGVDWPHEDLLPNIWINPGESGLDAQGKDKRTNGKDDDNDGFIDDYHGWDFVGRATLAELQSGNYHPDNDPSPRPNSIPGYEGYHGTLVAGCASARGDNAKGVVGVGFTTKLMGVKCAADSEGTGSVVAGYDGIRFAADMGVRVINCSWGGPVDAGSVQGLQTVINYAFSKGALVVAASGNAGTNNDQAPSYPANLKHVLSVGATDSRDSAANFSEYGVSVGVWAPGVSIYTTQPGNNYGATINGGSVDGTSFSSPIVSGVAALVAARHPDWNPDQIAMQLRVTGDRVKVRVPDFGPYFYRRVNAFRAVSLNATLNAGDPTGLPGIAIDGYTINGKTSDTIRDVNQSVTVQLTLHNLLSPASNVTIDALPNQTLAIGAPVTITSLGTMETMTKDLNVRLIPNSGVLYSEGNLQLILKVSSGSYEDVMAVQIPVRLPGWHEQVDRLNTGSFNTYTGNGIIAVTPKLAWTVSDVAISQTAEVPLVARTLDGESWTAFQQASGQDALYCITARDQQHAWTGSGPTGGAAAIFRTSNGGTSWLKTDVSAITPFVDAIWFFDATNGIFLGDPKNGLWGIGVTTDGGATWGSISPQLTAGTATEAGWNNSFAVFGNNVWFGTNNSRIYHSIDRGRTWTFSTSPSRNCFGISFGNANDGLASFAPVTNGGGGSYMLASTRDGGTSWHSVPLPFATAEPQGVSFVPNTTRAFVATQNGMFETSDFGVNWKQMPVPPVVFQGVTLSTAIDAGGHIASYGTSSFTQIITYKDSAAISTGVDPIPATPSTTNGAATLFQNMPNPSVRATTIPFELNAPASVTIVLYDALGMQTATLVRDVPMEVGRHEMLLTTDGLPAGTYFYTLRCGSEQLTRRLVVVR